MADHRVAFVLQTLLTMLQMLVQRSTAPLPQPSATSGHGELHELHVAKSTAENKQKGNQATMLGGSYSLLLVYFVVELQRHLQARHMYYSVSSGSSSLV